MPPQDQTSARVARLSKLFDAYIKGTRSSKIANDAKLFLPFVAVGSRS